MVQIAISMTCPKTPFTTEDNFPTKDLRDLDVFKPAEITNEELDNVRTLIKELGL